MKMLASNHNFVKKHLFYRKKWYSHTNIAIKPGDKGAGQNGDKTAMLLYKANPCTGWGESWAKDKLGGGEKLVWGKVGHF